MSPDITMGGAVRLASITFGMASFDPACLILMAVFEMAEVLAYGGHAHSDPQTSHRSVNWLRWLSGQAVMATMISRRILSRPDKYKWPTLSLPRHITFAHVSREGRKESPIWQYHNLRKVGFNIISFSRSSYGSMGCLVCRIASPRQARALISESPITTPRFVMLVMLLHAAALLRHSTSHVF